MSSEIYDDQTASRIRSQSFTRRGYLKFTSDTDFNLEDNAQIEVQFHRDFLHVNLL